MSRSLTLQIPDEVARTPDVERQRRVRALLQFVHQRQANDPKTTARAKELQALGFRAIDALHVASAEQSHCDVLLTTDDKMLSTAHRSVDQLRVRVENPVNWLQEVDVP